MTSYSTSEVSASKLVTFSGKKGDWDNWLFGFEARAVANHYDKLLTGEEKAPTAAEYQVLKDTNLEALKDIQGGKTAEEQKADIKAKIRLYSANGLAFSHLVTSMDITKDTTKTAIGLLRTCKTDDFPKGDAKLAIDTLNGYYNIRSVATAQSLLNDYHALELKGDQDPAIFVSKMQTLRSKIEEADKKLKIDDRAFLLRILNKLPEAYETTVDLIELEIDSVEDKLPDMNYVLEKLVLRYQRIQSRKGASNKNKDKDDVALFGGGFKGNCHKCGKRGHKSANCKSSEKGNAKKGDDKKPTSGNSGSTESKPDMSNVSCNYCKEKGHMKDTCPKLAAKKAKAEADKGEVGLVTVDLDKSMGECNYCGEIGLFCGPCKSCFVGVNDKNPHSIEGDTGLILVDKYCGVGRCTNCNGVGIRGYSCSFCRDAGVNWHSIPVPTALFGEIQAFQCNVCMNLEFGPVSQVHEAPFPNYHWDNQRGSYITEPNPISRMCSGTYQPVENLHKIHGPRSEVPDPDGFMELRGFTENTHPLRNPVMELTLNPTYPDIAWYYEPEEAGPFQAAFTRTDARYDETNPCVDMRVLDEIMSNDQNEIFTEIAGRLTLVDYEIEQFLQYVGERMYPEWDAEAVTLEFVQVYVYDFVRLNIETVAQLVSVLPHVQYIFVQNDKEPISNRMLNWMSAIAPIWIMAEFRFLLSNMGGLYNVPRQEFIDEMVALHVRGAAAGLVGRRRGGVDQGRNVRARNDDAPLGPRDDNIPRDDVPQNDNVGAELAMVDFSFFANSSSRTSHNNLWIGDSGASCHMTCSMDGMINVREVNSPVQVGTGQAIPCTKMGDKKVRVVQEDGAMKDIVLENCKYVPGLFTNLFSINTALAKDWMISNKGITISLDKDDTRISFDKTLRTDNGAITGVEMVPRMDGVNLTLEQGLVININKLHLLLGHACESTIRATAKHYGLTLKGSYAVCTDCALAKARQKNVNKETSVVSTKPGERFYLDISSTKARSFGGAKFWLLVIDHFTDMCWSMFLKAKSDLPESVFRLFTELRQANLLSEPPTIIRCDNSGENEALQALLKSKGFHAKFEYTAPGSPQYAGVVERKFATLYARVRSTLNSARLSQSLREGLWAEAAKYSTDIENSLVTTATKESSWSRFHKKEHPFIRTIRQFGEVAVVDDWQKRGHRAKLDNRGKPALYLGHAVDHATDVYRFLNLESNRIIRSRDVTWLNKTYATFKDIDGVVVTDDDDEPVDAVTTGTNEVAVVPVPEVPMVGNDADIEEEDEPVAAAPEPEQEKPARLTNELRRIETWNPVDVDMSSGRTLRSGREVDIADLCLFTVVPRAMVSPDHALKASESMDPRKLNPSSYKDHFEVPSKFNGAWNHPDEFQRNLWREAINLELAKMAKYKVWHVVKRNVIPPGRKCVKCKWVFDIKRNGVFRARLVACGYSQTPGVDFQESYSPVVNDAVFRMMLVMQAALGLSSKIIDIETAFLNGDLEEEIYMDAPEGIDAKGDECVQLDKSLYGLVQSARQFYLKFKQVMIGLGYKPSESEPCLFSKQVNGSLILIVVYVDDCYAVGNDANLASFIKEIQTEFKIKIQDTPTDYLSCEIRFDKENNRVWMGQPHLIKRLAKAFGDLVRQTSHQYLTPGTPNQSIIRPQNEQEQIDPERQKLYRSAVGTLLQFVKHTRPDISNPVRELSKCMDKATEAAYKEMLRVTKFVLDTKDFGLLSPQAIEEDGSWHLTVYSDSDWAGDPENRRSISGYIIFLLGCPLVWKSKQQQSVTLSSSEAEYVALSEAAKEIKFIAQTIESIGIKVKYPITVYVDNVGAIFMSENVTATKQTRHVHTRYRFVHEEVEDGRIIVRFVKTEDNKADPYTKNVKLEVYEKSISSYMIGKQQFDSREGVEGSVG
jgi:Reverse transcriptase (RNA-dependent DNA polymerase)/gag-polypeptide of LTR copia-type